VHRADEHAQHVDAGEHDAGDARRRDDDLSRKTPSRIRNSPTKFAEPGIASVASATMRNSRASTGARKARPPMSRMSCDPAARAASRPTMKNAGTVTTPWLTDWRIAPCAPSCSSENTPSTMNPSCATDE
jgi:hypothetical protein